MDKPTKGMKGRDWELSSPLSSLCRTASTNVGGNMQQQTWEHTSSVNIFTAVKTLIKMGYLYLKF